MPHDHPDHDHEHPLQPPQRRSTAATASAIAAVSTSPPSGPASNPPLERDSGRGKLLFLDAFSGLAGDMLVAALCDLGVPHAELADALSSLPLHGYELRWSRRSRSSISACAFDVVVHEAQPARTYAQIRDLLENASSIAEGARTIALRAFAVLAEAESTVHHIPVESVHFHEVGAIDSIVDTVAAAIAFDYLGAEVACSPLPIGRGFVRTAHGVLPLPAPATLLCLAGIPTYDAAVEAELVTPTGACLVRAAASSFPRWPGLVPHRVGWGAGTKELPDRPNLLRAVLGSAPRGIDAFDPQEASSHVVLELNVDDLSGELTAFALQSALEAGALDVWTTAIGMKKGRPAWMLSALVARNQVHPVSQALLRETSSLGMRVRPVDRIERPRRIVTVATQFGPIPTKIADGDGLPENAAPEYEACRTAAAAHGVPTKHVFAATIAAYWRERR